VALTESTERIAALRKEVGERITRFYEDTLKIKRVKFAEMLDWKYDSLLAYEKGRAEPGSLFFTRLKTVFPSADIGWILTGKKTILDQPPNALPVRRVPVVQFIPASVLTEGIPDEAVIDWVFTANLKDPHLFALCVRGDSMSPEINEGDYALCAPDMEFENGKIYAVVANGEEATLKYVHRAKGGWLLLPVNTNYPHIFVAEEKMTRMYRLVEVIRKYK